MYVIMCLWASPEFLHWTDKHCLGHYGGFDRDDVIIPSGKKGVAGMSRFATNWDESPPNGTNQGLLKINFSTFWHGS